MTSWQFAIFTLTLGVAVGCGLGTRPNDENSDQVQADGDCPQGSDRVGEDPKLMFKNSVHPIIVDNCASCHSRASRIGPHVAGDADIDVAYTDAKPRLMSNMLWLRGIDNHCAGCRIVTDTQKKADYKLILESWFHAETNPPRCIPRGAPGGGNNGGGGGGGGTGGNVDPKANLKFTADAIVPMALTTTGFKYLRYPLSSLGLANAVIEVGVKQLSPDYYEFGNFRLYPGSTPIRVSGIQVWVTSETTEATNNTLNSMTFTAVPPPGTVNLATIPLAVPLLTSQSIIGKRLSAVDRIRLSFKSIDPSAMQCLDLGLFQQKVLPLINTGFNGQNACVNCHVSGGSGASKWTMTPNNVSNLCYEFRRRMGPTDDTSLVIRKLIGQANPHGITVPSASVDPIRQWRDAEF